MMSSTRRAENGNPLRQERFASDPAFNEGLKASAVARKCCLLSDQAHRELALYLQAESMKPGGLSALVADFLKRYGNRIGSKTMRSNSTLKTFEAPLVRLIRDELDSVEFPLKGETNTIDPLGYEFESVRREAWEHSYDSDYVAQCEVAERTRQETIAASFSASYPAQDFIGHCMDHAESELESWLVDFCLNPKTTFASPPAWFHDLEQALKGYMADRREDSRAEQVVTSIGEQINDALDYAWDEKVLVHINGVARMGKTHQIRQWCSEYPGRVRYVQVPSGNDDISFLRAIARALGTAAGSAMKTTQIKRQIEDAIQDAGIMLVFDEAHYLFPQYKDVRSSPRRINWLLTEVVNKGIPAVIVSTPQFDMTQKAIVSGSGWASEQLEGRIAYRLDLPAILPPEDLAAIAKHYLPEASKELLQFLSAYARRSGKYLAGLEAVAKRARYLAKKSKRTTPNGADIEAAVTQVDPAIAQVFNQKEEPKNGEERQPAKPRKRPCKPAAQPAQAKGTKVAVTA